MAAAVKGRRPYDSPRRRAQAAATRTAILDAAQALFERDGFAAPSMPAIAGAAGVALKTVYVAFDTKAGLLHALWDVRLGGDEQPVPVVERPWYRALLEEPDPERQFAAFAAQSTAVKVRAGALMAVVREAAASEPAMAELWSLIQTEFRAVLRPLVERLAERGLLAAGLDVDVGTAGLWMVSHPYVCPVRAAQRGWSPARYERWLADTARSQLLAPGALRGLSDV
jgi:AcrR family transcriptional regulator